MTNLDPQVIADMSKADILKVILRTNEIIEELTQEVVGLKSELYERINPDGEVIENYALSRSERINVAQVPEGIAEEYGALKTVTTKKVDSAVVKALLKKGIELPGVSITQFLSMRNLERKSE